MNADMTLSEIGELCAVGTTTVRRWAKEASAKMAQISAKMAEARETAKAARFSLEETLAIVEAGKRGPLADLLRDNARTSRPPVTYTPEELSRAVCEALRITGALRSASADNEALPPPAPPVPELSDRALLVRYVRTTARVWQVPHSILWGDLYREFRDRFHVDLVTRARHSNRSTIAEAEAGGHCAALLQLAKQYLDRADFLRRVRGLMEDAR